MLVYDLDGLLVRQFTWDVIDSNSYLLIESNRALLIDPVDSSELFETIEPMEDVTVILTHCHFDHICGLNKLRELKRCTVYASSRCSAKIGSKTKNLSSTGNVFMSFYLQNRTEAADKSAHVIEPFTCKPADYVFDDSMTFCWEGHKIALSQVYGHSDDSLIVVLDNDYMFSGDALLNIPTVTRFPSGSTSRFWEEDISRFQAMSLKQVFPGHGLAGDLNDMIAVNKRPERYKSS